MTSPDEQIDLNLGRVRERMHAACAACDRSAADVTLVAVTKYARPEWVQGLIRLGVRELGESRPQQLAHRVPEFGDGLHWHLIGQLQRNKVRTTLPLTAMIHSVDSQRLLERIDRLAGEDGLRPKILVEVNVAGESAKAGFCPQQLVDHWTQIRTCTHPQILGLMTMAPRVDDPEQTRTVFRGLRELRDRLRDVEGDPDILPELSMGMSADFEVAIQEGATLVRVGSRLFEGLAPDA
jgi:pyridoxal phosphate enzyme (YggS family)